MQNYSSDFHSKYIEWIQEYRDPKKYSKKYSRYLHENKKISYINRDCSFVY